MNERERNALIEQVTTAWRPTDVRSGGTRPLPAFYDLDDAGRQEAHEATRQLRQMEAALDPEGLSSTAHAVLRRIREAQP